MKITRLIILSFIICLTSIIWLGVADAATDNKIWFTNSSPSAFNIKLIGKDSFGSVVEEKSWPIGPSSSTGPNVMMQITPPKGNMIEMEISGFNVSGFNISRIRPFSPYLTTDISIKSILEYKGKRGLNGTSIPTRIYELVICENLIYSFYSLVPK